VASHEFWPDDTRLVEPPFPLDRLGSYRQLTDVHLAALAASRKGKLVTFARGIPSALPTAERAVVDLLPIR
jgi:uncharacterized protein